GSHCWFVGFGPDDGKTLITVSHPSDITVWDFAKRVKRKTIPRKGGVYGTPALSPDGKAVALGSRFIRKKKDGAEELAGKVELWDLTTGKVRASIPLDVSPRSFAFAPNGKLLAVGCHGKEKLDKERRAEEGGAAAVML